QEERHHDGRRRDPVAAPGADARARRDPPGRADPFAADHDDDVRGRARRGAARDRHRPGRLAASAARHHGDGRADPQPDVHALYDAGDLSVPRPSAGTARQMVRGAALEPRREAGTTGYEGMTMKISTERLSATRLSAASSGVARLGATRAG